MAGLLGNVVRFIYISFITWPWLVLPFEFLQGVVDKSSENKIIREDCCLFNTRTNLRNNYVNIFPHGC
jgi:hypothetical protein